MYSPHLSAADEDLAMATLTVLEHLDLVRRLIAHLKIHKIESAEFDCGSDLHTSDSIPTVANTNSVEVTAAPNPSRGTVTSIKLKTGLRPEPSNTVAMPAIRMVPKKYVAPRIRFKKRPIFAT